MLPNFIYHIDPRQPDIILKKGFSYSGNDYNLNENITLWAYITNLDDFCIFTTNDDIERFNLRSQ